MRRIIDIPKFDKLHYIKHEKKTSNSKNVIINNSWTDQNLNLL